MDEKHLVPLVWLWTRNWCVISLLSDFERFFVEGQVDFKTEKNVVVVSLKTNILWVVVSNIFYFHPYLGKIPILTNIFQTGWNHQLDKHSIGNCWWTSSSCSNLYNSCELVDPTYRGRHMVLVDFNLPPRSCQCFLGNVWVYVVFLLLKEKCDEVKQQIYKHVSLGN